MIDNPMRVKDLIKNLAKGDSGKTQLLHADMSWRGSWSASRLPSIKRTDMYSSFGRSGKISACASIVRWAILLTLGATLFLVVYGCSTNSRVELDRIAVEIPNSLTQVDEPTATLRGTGSDAYTEKGIHACTDDYSVEVSLTEFRGLDYETMLNLSKSLRANSGSEAAESLATSNWPKAGTAYTSAIYEDIEFVAIDGREAFVSRVHYPQNDGTTLTSAVYYVRIDSDYLGALSVSYIDENLEKLDVDIDAIVGSVKVK